MEQEVKVAFYLKKNEMKEDGRCPVMARLMVGESESTTNRAPRSQVVFSTKVHVSVSLWTSGRVKGKSLQATNANRQLDEIRASALSIYRELSAVRENVMAEEIKNVLLGMASGQETLLAYNYIKKLPKFRQVVTKVLITNAMTYDMRSSFNFSIKSPI